MFLVPPARSQYSILVTVKLCQTYVVSLAYCNMCINPTPLVTFSGRGQEASTRVSLVAIFLLNIRQAMYV